MRNEAASAKRMMTLALTALFAVAAAFALAACSMAGKYKIDYGDQKSDYKNPPTSANAGDQVEVTCMVEVADAVMVFYVDGSLVDAEYDKSGTKVIRFTMPGHDVTVQYRIVSDPAGGRA